MQHHWHHRAFYLGVLGVALVIVGLLALNFPVFIDAYDKWGWQIKCGTGFSTDLSQAGAAGESYAEQCQSAVTVRRLWAIPMVAIGALVATGVVAVAALAWGREPMFDDQHHV